MSENKDSPKDVQSSLGAHTTLNKDSALSHVGHEPNELNKGSQERLDKISHLSHKQEKGCHRSHHQVKWQKWWNAVVRHTHSSLLCSVPSAFVPPRPRAVSSVTPQRPCRIQCAQMAKEHEGYRRTAGCGRVCILRTAWKTHTREEARDHDAENQDKDLPG